MPTLYHRGHHSTARVGHERRAGIRHQRQVLSSVEPAQNAVDTLTLVVGVNRHERCCSVHVVSKYPCTARILREDTRDAPEGLGRSGREISKITDRSTDEIKSGHLERYDDGPPGKSPTGPL